MAARFNFDLGDSTKTQLTIENSSSVVVATSIGGAGPAFIQNNGDGTYYVDGLSTDTHTVIDNGTDVNGLENVSYIADNLLDHLDDSTPHSAYLYTAVQILQLLANHHLSTSTDHDDRYYTETEVDALIAALASSYAPGNANGFKPPTLTAEPTANAANENLMYIYLSGNATTGKVELKQIHRSNFSGTSFEATVVKELKTWSGA